MIIKGSAEPALSAFAPRLPAGGCDLFEAYKLHVAEHPQVIEAGGAAAYDVRPFAIYVQKSRRAVWNRPSRHHKKWKEYYDVTINIGGGESYSQERWRWTGSEEQRAADYRVRVEEAKRKWVWRAATAAWIGLLARGELELMGVPENNLPNLDLETIAPEWMSRATLIDMTTNELWEQIGPKSKNLARRFSSVRVYNAGDAALATGDARAPVVEGQAESAAIEPAPGATPEEPPEGHTPKSHAEGTQQQRKCEKRLREIKNAGEKDQRKEKYGQTLQTEIAGLSWKAFERAWGNVMGGDPNWTKTGPISNKIKD